MADTWLFRVSNVGTIEQCTEFLRNGIAFSICDGGSIVLHISQNTFTCTFSMCICTLDCISKSCHLN